MDILDICIIWNCNSRSASCKDGCYNLDYGNRLNKSDDWYWISSWCSCYIWIMHKNLGGFFQVFLTPTSVGDQLDVVNLIYWPKVPTSKNISNNIEQENMNKVIGMWFKAKRIVSTITDLLPGI